MDKIFYKLSEFKSNTPCFVYKMSSIDKQIQTINNAIKHTSAELYYAIKANNNPIIVKLFIKQDIGLSVSSIEELKFVLGFGANKISYTAPYIEGTVLKIAKKHQFVEVIFNNMSELDINYKGRFGVRINPQFGDSFYKCYKAGGLYSQFGVKPADILKSKINPQILHMHISSDSNREDVYLKAFNILLSIARVKSKVDTINIGGGYSVGFVSCKQIKIEKLLGSITAIVLKFEKETGRKIKLQLEPGSFLVRKSGYYLTSIRAEDIKYNRKYLFCDGSKHHLRGLDVKTGDLYAYESKNTFNGGIYGKTCQRSDCILKSKNLPYYIKNDLVIIKNVGAYCAVQSDEFHLLSKPKEYIIN